ncbi:hypothetical protein E3A20_22410 [Planctomyces bekefii]|uniref:Uncharacterized protein n=1 Tax=Planctomyces bekefii TaxID=1653850 RepID=A0A5C6M6G9_9PLAN|nr:hypothetical protein E3A20_22410 [Planctomyces bekefii]
MWQIARCFQSLHADDAFLRQNLLKERFMGIVGIESSISFLLYLTLDPCYLPANLS